MKKSFILVLISSLVFFISGCDTKSGIDENLVVSSSKEKKIGQEFESKKFNLTTLDGKIIELETTLTGIKFNNIKDKMVLIDIFATWCPPCIKGIPDMNALQDKYKDDLVIVSVLFERDKTREELEKFIKKHEINYYLTVGEENFKLAKELGEVSKVPEYYLYNKEGVYIKKFVGETKKEVFEEYIESTK